MKEPDLGTALVHLAIAGSMLFLAGVQRGTIIRLALIGGLLAVPGWHMLKDYQKQRVINFITPEADPLGTGYHAIQSKIAVGSGAVTGKGFMKGTQTQLRFLPEQTTDFIFSVLAEEWGFMGSLVILTLYSILILRVLGVAARAPDQFSLYVCYGVAAMMFWHVFVNIGMVIGVVPVVGVTLKLLSYGGSSVIAAMAGIGLVAGFSIRKSVFT
jgi:rod shape determining protein RodA